LLEDNKEWIDCFIEAVLFSSGKTLRMLFTTELLYGNITDLFSLWKRFRQNICDDLLYYLQQQQILIDHLEDPYYDYGLFLIYNVLADHEKTLTDFRLPPYQHDWSCTIGNPLIATGLNYNITEEWNLYTKQYMQLNTDQTNCFNTIITSIAESPKTSHFFLQGPAGTGKTFLYKTICHYYRSLGKIVLYVASSGIAALLLLGGWTSHSRFKIPLEVHESATCAISKTSNLADLLWRTSLIIWDKVPMQHKYCFEAVHHILADICSDSLHSFGGIPTILGDDFAQILPVVRLGSREATVNAYIQKSFLWPQLQQLKLQQNMQVRIGEDN
jgi:PIF1-like helicase